MNGLCPVTLQVDTIGSFQFKRRCSTFVCDETAGTIGHDIGVVELTILLDQMCSPETKGCKIGKDKERHKKSNLSKKTKIETAKKKK